MADTLSVKTASETEPIFPLIIPEIKADMMSMAKIQLSNENTSLCKCKISVKSRKIGIFVE